MLCRAEPLTKTTSTTWLLESFPQQVMNLVHVWVQVEEDTILSTHYLHWFLGVLLVYLTIQVILSSTAKWRLQQGYFEIKQHSSSRLWKEHLQHSCMMDSLSKWWERVILFAWHAFSLRFLSLGSHFRQTVFFRLFYKNLKALQRIRWVITMANSCTLLKSM